MPKTASIEIFKNIQTSSNALIKRPNLRVHQERSTFSMLAKQKISKEMTISYLGVCQGKLP